MKKFFQKALLWVYIKYHTIMVAISIALYNTEIEILKADPNNLQERDKRVQRKLHRNPMLEKFYAGQSDEKYVQEYYDVLKKADKFIRTATPNQRLLAIDKHMRHLNEELDQKDQYGRRYNYTGFFDEKHKHAGKTLGEVLENEMEERRTKDDDFKLLYMFNNKPIEVGFVKVLDVLEKNDKEDADFEYEVQDMFKKSKSFEFPIKIEHNNNNIVNKIEQLTEYLHVKKIGFEHRQLEFFIPLKFKTSGVTDQSEVFNELTDVKEVFVKDEYGKLIAFGVTKFLRRIIHNDTHEVWKFQGIEMKQMGI